jgi:predicted amidohydrolase YtcJ
VKLAPLAPELILRSGSLHTLDARGSLVEAMASRGGRIVALGSDREVLRLRGARTQVVDLHGSFAAPGFIDCHTHFAKRALGITRVDLHGARSREAMVARLVKARRKTAKGEWVLGRGWDESKWQDRRFPTRADLDGAIADRPVKASRIDGHSCVVNTLGWKTLRIPASFPGVERDAHGRTTGVLKEAAYEETLDRIVDPPALYRKALPIMERRAHALGVTTVCDFVDPKDLRAYTERHREGKLRIRVSAAMWTRHLDALESGGFGRGLGDEWLRLTGVKMYGDGSIGSRTAAMYRPYRDDPSTRGALNLTRARMAKTIGRARALGLQVCVHAIGERGIDEVLTAFEDAAEGDGAAFRRERHRIEHCELVTPAGIRRMKRLGLIASVQPNFVGNWSAKGELYDQRIGSRWQGKDNPFRQMVDAGLCVAFGSDNMPFSPLYGIHSAVNAPFPSQRLRLSEALAAYTRDAAFAIHEETNRGTLEVGKLADVVVLSGDPNDSIHSINELAIEMTILDGRIVYRPQP